MKKSDSEVLMDLFGGEIPSQVHENYIRSKFEHRADENPTDEEIVAEIRKRNLAWCGHK